MNPQKPVSPIAPGLIVLHSNRMEVLRDGLIQWLGQHPLDPLETDIVAVQSNGIAQWLRSTLARSRRAPEAPGSGIAAALETPMPSRLMWSLYRRVLGAEAVPEHSPLDEKPLVWRLMRLLGKVGASDVYQPLHRFLKDDDDLRKRYQLAQRLADLFDQYQVYRADWLSDWAQGRDVQGAAGNTRPLDPDQLWQAALWRDILKDVGSQSASGRAAVHAAFLETLRNWPDPGKRPDLPRRIVVFGVSSLPRQALEALVEASAWTQVLVCVHNPCEYHWADIVEGRALLRSVRRHQQGRPGRPLELDPEQLHAHAHPLLASWGRQGRDYIALFEELEDEVGQRGGGSDPALEVAVVPAFVEVEAATVLGQLQDDIRGLRSLPEICQEGRVVPPSDHSLCFHVAHSALREVEILHDRLLAAFQDDASLQPDDVIVMVPDIEAYAAHIEAVFGLHPHDDRRYLPYFLVDRGPREVNTVVDAVERLLSLPLARMGVGEMLDLLDVEAVRQRFGFHEGQIAVLRDWIQGANIRWGLDRSHRQELGLAIAPELADVHTWEFGLRRMLLGYATGDTDDWNDIAPYGDVAGLEAGLVGALAMILDRLLHYSREFSEPATPELWGRRFRQLMADFLAPPDDVANYTIEQLNQALDIWLDECEATGFDETLTLAVAGRHWLSGMDGAGMAQRFTSGAITFATLMPMRAIPFRHVCLLGMNDGDYPRPRTPAHFDLMEKNYRPGDRSRRDDDRYLFLEALLSARERLYISWVGRSIVDNSEQPPSVLVAQLRDHLAAGWTTSDEEGGLLAQLTIAHPLQAFSPLYFRDASPGARLFTFGSEWRAAEEGADSRRGVVSVAYPGTVGARGELDALPRDEALSINELRVFLEHPVREFFRQRLQVRHNETETVADEETFVADGLQVWQLHDALIRAARKPLQEGADAMAACDAALARMLSRGELAFGGAGLLQAQRSRELLQPVFAEYQSLLTEWPQAVAEQFELRHERPGTPALTGWLGGLRRNSAGELVRLEMQATQLVKAKDKYWRDEKLIGHWLWHLAANSAGLSMTSVVLSPAGTARFDPLAASQASAWLETLLWAWGEGMRRPLPIKAEFARPVLTALPLANLPAAGTDDWRAMLASEKLLAQLRQCHATEWNQAGRREAPYEARAYPTFDTLFADGELVEWALTLYEPLFLALRSRQDQENATEAK